MNVAPGFNTLERTALDPQTILGSTSPRPKTDEETSTLAKKTAAIILSKIGNKKAFASSVKISPNHLLTSKHVVDALIFSIYDDNGEHWIQGTQGNSRAKAIGFYHLKDIDMAIVVLDRNLQGPYAKIARKETELSGLFFYDMRGNGQIPIPDFYSSANDTFCQISQEAQVIATHRSLPYMHDISPKLSSFFDWKGLRNEQKFLFSVKAGSSGGAVFNRNGEILSVLSLSQDESAIEKLRKDLHVSYMIPGFHQLNSDYFGFSFGPSLDQIHKALREIHPDNPNYYDFTSPSIGGHTTGPTIQPK